MRINTFGSQKGLLVCLLLAGLFLYGCAPQEVDNTAETQALMDKVQEMWSTGNVDQAAELFAEGFVRMAPDGKVEGVDGLKELVAGVRSVYPDFQVEINEYVRKGDVVYSTWTVKGTNTGAISEAIPATGKTVEATGMSKNEIRDGKIIKEWAMWDRMGVYQQLGFELMPPKPALAEEGQESDGE